jgi:2-phospho-L-lactate guanylyltransferase
VLEPAARRRLALRNAELALAAAAAGRVVAVAGSAEAAELAARAGAEVIVEAEPRGQNAAAQRAIEFALAAGSADIVLLSSDLPLVTPEVVAGLVEAGARMPRPAALAAPATGRGGTNALYLSPPDALPLSFGDQSLAKFERAAAERGVNFALFESPELALDVDEPSDLARLGQIRPA